MITRQEICDLVLQIGKEIQANDFEFIGPEDIIESSFIKFLEDRELLEES